VKRRYADLSAADLVNSGIVLHDQLGPVAEPLFSLFALLSKPGYMSNVISYESVGVISYRNTVESVTCWSLYNRYHITPQSTHCEGFLVCIDPFPWLEQY